MHSRGGGTRLQLYTRAQTKDDWELVGPITIEQLPEEGPPLSLPYQTVKVGIGAESAAVSQRAHSSAVVAARKKEVDAHSVLASLIKWATRVSLAVLERFDGARYKGESGRLKLLQELRDIKKSLPHVDAGQPGWAGTFPLPWPVPWVARLQALQSGHIASPSAEAGHAAASEAAPIMEHTRVAPMGEVKVPPASRAGVAKSYKKDRFYLYSEEMVQPFFFVGKVMSSHPDRDGKIPLQIWSYGKGFNCVGEARKLANGNKWPTWLNVPLEPTAPSAHRLIHVDCARIVGEVNLTGRNILTTASRRLLKESVIARYANK